MPEWGPAGSNTYAWPCEPANAASLRGHSSHRRGDGMIPRYSMPEMSAIFADETRLGIWHESDLLAVEAWSKLGVVPLAHAAASRERAPKIDATFVRRVAEREAVIDHDVAAFVDVVQESIGEPEGSWIHYGLTSSDVVDTALCATLTRASDLLTEAASGLVGALKARATESI